MTMAQIVSRIAALEAEVTQLKRNQLPEMPAKNKAWVEQIWGSFADDPLFDEAMRLGRKWREAQRPKIRSRNKTPKNGRGK